MFVCFFCSNALIALARLLCKCLLAVLITASEAEAVAASRLVVSSRMMSFQATPKNPEKAPTKTKNKPKHTHKTPKNEHHEVE